MAGSKKHHSKDGLRLRGAIYWTRDPRTGKDTSTGCKDRSAARSVRAEWERQAANPRYAAAQGTTVEHMIADALEGKIHRKGRVAKTITADTMQFYGRKLGHARRIFGAETPIGQIDFDAVGRYINTRLSEPGAKRGTRVQPHTVHKELSALRFALRRQVRHGNYPHDPDYVTRKGEFSDGYEPEKRTLTWTDIPKLLTALVQGTTQTVPWATLAAARKLREEGCSVGEVAAELGVSRSTALRYLNVPLADPRAAAVEHAQAAAWIICTAARVSEMRLAQLKDHNFTTWRVYMRGRKSKKSTGWIPIAPPFRRLLEFATHGRPKTGPIFDKWGNINRGLELACERAGLAKVSPNDLRRTHTDLLSKAGVNNSTLKGVSRHSTTRMLDEVYTREDIGGIEHLLSAVAFEPESGD